MQAQPAESLARIIFDIECFKLLSSGCHCVSLDELEPLLLFKKLGTADVVSGALGAGSRKQAKLQQR